MQQKKIIQQTKKEEKIKNKSKSKNFKKINSYRSNHLQNQQEARSEKIRQYFTKIIDSNILKGEFNSAYAQIMNLHENIAINIAKGSLNVSQTSKPIESLLKSPEIQIKISQTDLQIYEKQAKRIQHLKLIASINKQLHNKPTQQQVPYILTKQQHQKKITEIIEEKRKRQKKIQELKKIMREKQQIKLKQEQEKQKILKEKQKQKKKLQISQKIMKQKQQHIHFLSQQIKHRKQLENVVTRIPLHVKMEEKFKSQILIPQQQEKYKQYKTIKSFKQKYSLDTIKRHQSQYLSYKSSFNQRLNLLSNRKIVNSLNIPLKSQKLKNILAEQIRNNKMIFQQKKLYIQEKIKRQENYYKKLKQQHQPKIDLDKKKQIQKRLIKQTEHLSKISLNRNIKKIGVQYLNEAKKIIKKTKDQQKEFIDQYHSQSLTPLKRSFSQHSFAVQNQNNQILEKLRQKKLMKLLNCQKNNEQKFEKLLIQTRKIKQIKQRKLGFLKHSFNENLSKQASNLAINSIKAKIGMIELIKKQQN